MPGALILLASIALAAERPPAFPTSGLPAPAPDELPGLVALLDSGRWNERIHAVERLGVMGPPAREALVGALRDGDWQVRLTAVHWLGRQGESAIEPLAAAMTRDPCRVVRLSALQWLGRQGPRALEALRQAQRDDNPYMRQSAYYWESKIEPDDDAEAAASRERADGELASLSEAQKANACASQPGPGKLRRVAARPRPAPDAPALAASSGPVSKPLENWLVDVPEPPARPAPEGADAALAQPPPKDARYAELDGLLWDTEELSTPTFKAREQHSPEPESDLELARRGDPSLLLAPRLGAPEDLPAADSSARRAPKAAGVEVSVAPRAGVSSELSSKGRAGALADGAYPRPKIAEQDDVPAELMKSVEGKAAKDVLPILIAALAHPNSRCRAWAADEIGHLGAPAALAVPNLTAALADTAARVRASAALALGNVGAAAEPAVPALVKRLKDKSADVRDSAALGLFRVGTPKARKAFRRHVRDEARRTIEGS